MKCIYIKGNVLIKEGGIFYTRDLVTYAKTIPNGADIIEPEGGILVIDDVYGSPYCNYYVSGNIAGYNSPFILTNPDLSPDFLIKKFSMISALLSMDKTKDDIHNLFLQEQYLAVYSLIEFYLFSLILRGLLKPDRFQNLLDYDYNTVEKNTYKIIPQLHKIIKRNDINNDEKYLKIVSYLKGVIYHRKDNVEILYKIIFDYNFTDKIKILDGAFIDRRNDFAHRLGYNKDMIPTKITKEDIETLIEKAKNLIIEIYEGVKTYL